MSRITGNLLIDHLPPGVRQACLEQSELVRVQTGDEILRQEEHATHAFFPGSAICSLTVGLKSGNKAEAALVGREGLVGVSLLDGTRTSAFAALVQVPGDGYRVPLGTLLALLQNDPALRNALVTYAGYKLRLLGRSVACNAYHSIVERLARWLLLTHDRVERDEFPLTHEILSQMLAATRPRVSLAAGRLRKLGMIDYRRGRFRVLDRPRLEATTCECYATARAYRRVLPWVAN